MATVWTTYHDGAWSDARWRLRFLIAGALVLAVLYAVSGVIEPIDTVPMTDPNLAP